jgi:hypothetical protein
MNESLKKIICLVFVSISLTGFSTVNKVVQTDIVIYGATSGGVVAAQAAALQGLQVFLADPSTHVGGMSSGGLGQTDIGNKFAITGLSRAFYKEVGKHYGKSEQWIFEPHVAENIFRKIISEHRIDYRPNYSLKKVESKNGSIRALHFINKADGSIVIVKAKMFIDCSYEGDLMARAGVSYTIGREANSVYNETYNGVQLLDKHQFPNGVDPYKIQGNPESGLLYGITPDKLLPNGSGDRKLQAYNFRLCLTNHPENKIPVTRPPDYDSSRYELLLRQLAVYTPDSLNWQLMHFAWMPNHKTDINNCGGFSTDMIGANYNYPEATETQRQQIIKEHEAYTKGLIYFIGNDPRMPQHLRNEMLQWGYPKDEYVSNENFTPQLYIRESRRMIGPYVMTQQNCQGKEIVPDGIGLAAYTMDSHNCQRIVVDGMVKNEGDVQVGGFPPYPVAYRSIIPKKNQCKNLLVPVCLSASHIAYGSIRMEPVFMVLGQAAATAAAQAIKNHQAVQDIDVQALQMALGFNK